MGHQLSPTGQESHTSRQDMANNAGEFTHMLRTV